MDYDPTQKVKLHRDLETFDDPVRKVGHDATAEFDNSESNPTEHASSEALESATTEGEPAEGAGRLDPPSGEVMDTRRRNTDAAETGADVADKPF